MKNKLKSLFKKIPLATLLTLGGIILGHVVGVLFTNIGIASGIAWEAILIFLGGVSGLVLGFTIDLEE